MDKLERTFIGSKNLIRFLWIFLLLFGLNGKSYFLSFFRLFEVKLEKKSLISVPAKMGGI